MKALNTLKRFWRDDQGLETVEYAIITGLIVAATIMIVNRKGMLPQISTNRCDAMSIQTP